MKSILGVFSQNHGKKSGGGALDKDKFGKYLDIHAKSKSQGKCAAAVRKALEAVGMNTSGRPGDAKDYGPFLTKLGAKEIFGENSIPEREDIAVFGGNETHPHGSIEAYDGK